MGVGTRWVEGNARAMHELCKGTAQAMRGAPRGPNRDSHTYH